MRAGSTDVRIEEYLSPFHVFYFNVMHRMLVYRAYCWAEEIDRPGLYPEFVWDRSKAIHCE